MSSSTVSSPSAHPTSYRTEPSFNVVGVAARSVFNAGLCALTAHTFSIMAPGGAAVFGAVSSVLRNGLRYGTANDTDPFLATIGKGIFVYAAAAAGGALFSHFVVGMPITFGASLVLTNVMFLTSCAVTAIAVGCLCCGIVATVLAAVSQNGQGDSNATKNTAT